MWRILLLVGMQTGTVTVKTVWTFLKKKLKEELPYDPAILLLGTYPKKTKSTNLKRYMHPNVHVCA